MTYDNEAIVRNAYHTAEGNVLGIPGWIGSFTEDGVFNKAFDPTLTPFSACGAASLNQSVNR